MILIIQHLSHPQYSFWDLCLIPHTYHCLSQSVHLVDQSLSSKQSVLVQVASLPKRIKNRLTYRARIIFCAGKSPPTSVFLLLTTPASRPFQFGDTLYIITQYSRFVPPSFIYQSQPSRVRSSRNLTHLTICNPLDVHLVSHPDFFTAPLVWVRSYFMSCFLRNNLPSEFTLALLFGEQSHLNHKQWQILKY